jgi:hypothetical protein
MELCHIQRSNFAMGTLDMLEISPEIATHQLNINPIVHMVH